jgi:hypothetical protein
VGVLANSLPRSRLGARYHAAVISDLDEGVVRETMANVVLVVGWLGVVSVSELKRLA